MRTSIRYSVVSRICGAVTALWLCGAGAAWAGGGGGDLVTLQSLLQNSDGKSGLCQIFNINPCPIPPTVTQTALELAALGNNLFEMLLAQNNIVPKGSRVYAGNPAADIPPGSGLPGCRASLPISSTTTPTVRDCLSTLTPLAFISQSPGTATAKPTQVYDSSADTFLYAVALSSTGVSGARLPKPDKVYFFYEALFRTNQNSTINAQLQFPLSVLNSDGTERTVPTTLNFTGTNGGDCSMSNVVGNFNGNAMGTNQTLTNPKTQIGVDCTVVFSASPASAQNHAIFEVAVPLLVTTACSTTACLDPLYFYSFNNSGVPNPVNSPLAIEIAGTEQTAGQGVYTAFEQEVGYAAGSSVLGTGLKIGLAPNAGSLAGPGQLFKLALCASLPVNTNGTGAQLRPAVGAFYAMATSGEILLGVPLASAFLAGGSPPSCPQPPQM
jgi:hypothetical protein